MGQSRGTKIRGLIAGLTAGLVMTACATAKSPAPGMSTRDPVADRCATLVESLSYAEKSVGGRVAATMILGPIGLGLGLVGAAFGSPQGLAIPVMLIGETVDAARENREQFGRIREACATAGGPDHVAVAEAIGSLALLRVSQRSPKEAVRLYRDGLALLERTGEEELEGAVRFQLAAASAMSDYPPSREEGAAVYARTLAALEARLGPDHLDLVSVLEPYARLLRTLSRENEANAVDARIPATQSVNGATSATGITMEEPCAEPAPRSCTR
jgi:hypothetical protein